MFSDKSIEGETKDIEVSADGKTLFLMQNDSILVKGIGNETNISISAAGVFDILVSGDYFFYETKANGKCNSNVVAVTELLGNPDTQIKPSSHGPTKIAFLGVNSKNEGQAIAYYQTTDENGVSKTAQIAISAEGTSDITPDLPYAIGDDTLGTFNYGNSACFFTAEKSTNCYLKILPQISGTNAVFPYWIWRFLTTTQPINILSLSFAIT